MSLTKKSKNNKLVKQSKAKQSKAKQSKAKQTYLRLKTDKKINKKIKES